ncbi:unnamed protein product, partial [marine sediment metagenome]
LSPPFYIASPRHKHLPTPATVSNKRILRPTFLQHTPHTNTRLSASPSCSPRP